MRIVKPFITKCVLRGRTADFNTGKKSLFWYNLNLF